MHSVSSRSRYAHYGTALRVWLCIMRVGGVEGEREGSREKGKDGSRAWVEAAEKSLYATWPLNRHF